MNTEEIIDRFQNARKSGRGWIVQCPAHDDRKNSLSLTEVDGKLLLKCQAGCDTKAVIDAVGLEWRDLFADTGNNKPPDHPVIQRYVYTDENGNPLYRVCRTASKNFFQERCEGGAYIPGLNGTRRVLYNLPDLLRAKTVFVVEGEKDAETLRYTAWWEQRTPAAPMPGAIVTPTPSKTSGFLSFRIMTSQAVSMPGESQGLFCHLPKKYGSLSYPMCPRRAMLPTTSPSTPRKSCATSSGRRSGLRIRTLTKNQRPRARKPRRINESPLRFVFQKLMAPVQK